MIINPVKNHTEALAVALIRNECRQYMTRDTRALDVETQVRFFDHLPEGLTLYLVRLFHLPIGYAIIRINGDEAWLTAGIAKPFRGKGHGRELFSELVAICEDKADKLAWLEVLRTNKRAIRLYQSLGFKTVRETKRLLIMRHDPTA